MKTYDGGSPRSGVVARLVVLSTGLAALLWVGGDPRLTLPSPGAFASASVWRQWLAAREVVDVLLASARAALLALNVWLLTVGTVALLARIGGWIRPALWTERLTPPIARGLVRWTLGLGVAVATLAPPAAAGATDRSRTGTAADIGEGDDDVPLLRRLPAPVPESPDDLRQGGSPAVPPRPPSAAGPTARPGPREPPGPTPPPEPGEPPGPTSPPPGDTRTRPDTWAQRVPAPPGVPSAARVWTVSPGDHFWSIAETVVERTEPNPPVRHVRRYWRQLIEANRSRLVDPSNPDYILPGQQLRLPPSGG